MTNLETMQREGREALKKDFNNLYQKEYTTDFKEKRLIRNTEIDIMSLDNLDQHTANTWKAAQESLRQEIALDLRETFMEDDGEDSYIQLSARIVLFIRKLEKQHD